LRGAQRDALGFVLGVGVAGKNEAVIAIVELLGVLSLSTQAYEQLKAGIEKDTVKTLSPLQRYC
jgi:hypothetical protein